MRLATPSLALVLAAAALAVALAVPGRRSAGNGASTPGTAPARTDLVERVRQATPEAGAPSPASCAALREAVVQRLASEPRAVAELVPAWRLAGAALRAELLAAVEEHGDPAALEFLAWVATFEGVEHHRALASAVLVLAPRAREPEAREALERLCVLLDSEDEACVQTVSLALTRARVEAAVPQWIELLASSSRGVRERARRALEELSGLVQGSEPERWRAWYEAESAWLADEAPEVLSLLDSGDDAQVLAALRALAGRRLERETLAEAVAEVLEHPSPSVRRAACAALESLGSRGPLPALADALADEDESVVQGAWSALRRLTGLELPCDAGLWRERLAGT